MRALSARTLRRPEKTCQAVSIRCEARRVCPVMDTKAALTAAALTVLRCSGLLFRPRFYVESNRRLAGGRRRPPIASLEVVTMAARDTLSRRGFLYSAAFAVGGVMLNACSGSG